MGPNYFVHFTDEDTDVQRLNRPCEISATIIPHLSEEETKAQRGQVNVPKITAVPKTTAIHWRGSPRHTREV